MRVIHFAYILGADVNLADFRGQTPLHMCVGSGMYHQPPALLKLLSAGAIVDKYVYNY